MRLRVILSLSVVASSALATARLSAETDSPAVPPAPAAQAEYDGIEPELTPVSTVFQSTEEPSADSVIPPNTEESEDEIIFDDP